MCDYGRLVKPNYSYTEFGFGNSFGKLEGSDIAGESSASETVAEQYNVADGFVRSVWLVADEATDMLIKKQSDYGPHNIGRAPGGPLNGLVVRIHDKVSRITHLTGNDVDPQNESLRDSFVDLANYALIALMVLDGTWPKE